MNQLCRLPVELVCLVTDHLDSFSVTRLWMTGDSRMKQLFQRGGVQQLTWQNVFGFATCPPVFALQLPYLSRLTLSFDAKDPFSSTETYLKALPTSLQALSLSGSGFGPGIVSWLSSCFHRLSSLHTLRLPLLTEIPDDCQKTLPPNLTILGIHVSPNSDGTALQLPHLKELCFSRDNRKPLVSLDHLTSLHTFVSPSDIAFSSFPPNLLHFTLDSDSISGIYHLLPETLESLHVETSSFNTDMISKIPRNVRSLRFREPPYAENRAEDVLWDLECVKALPPRLTSLDAKKTLYEDELDLGTLLPHLLLFNPSPYNMVYSPELFHYLDDEYCVTGNDGDSKVKRTTLPPNLTFLGSYSDSMLKTLPILADSIKKLEWGIIPWGATSIRFPSGLTSLRAQMTYNPVDVDNFSKGTASYLPPSVTEAALTIDHALNPALFLSPNLVKLQLRILKRLNSVSTGTIATSTPNAWISCLPTTLTTLDISITKSLDDEFFRHLHVPNLTKLALRGITSECTIFQRLDSLPHDLVKLQLYSHSEIDWKTMKLLQFTRLKRLTVRSKLLSKVPSSLTIDVLPRKLTKLIVSESFGGEYDPQMLTKMREAHVEFRGG